MDDSIQSSHIFHNVACLDFAHLDEESLQDIFPLLYFSYDDIEDLVAEKLHKVEYIRSAYEQIQLLDTLSSIDLISLWEECQLEHKNRKMLQGSSLTIFGCNDFERQTSAEVKAKLIMQQLNHLLFEEPNESCVLRRCCTILESPNLLDDITSYITAIVSSLCSASLLPEIISGLSLHSSTASCNLIRRLILNFPHTWPAVWQRLIAISISGNQWPSLQLPTVDHFDRNIKSQLLNSSRAMNTLHFAIEFIPDGELILDRCVELRCLPDFVLSLALTLNETMNYCLLSFFNRIFFAEGNSTRDWFSAYIKTISSTSPRLITEINRRLLFIGSSIQVDSKNTATKEELIKALEFVRVIAALRGFCDFGLNSDLRQFLLQLVTRPTCVSERAVNFICYALAFTIGFRSCLIGSLPGSNSSSNNDNQASENEEQIVNWLRRLLARQDVFHAALRQYDEVSHGVATPSYSQLLLLLALLYHTNQQVSIREIIANVLGVDSPCLSRNISASRKLFTHRVFNEQSIVNQAAHVPVTIKLNEKMSGHLPIHCILQLLKSHAFNKNRVEIKGWIYRQICSSVRPLHPQLPDLVEAYTSSCLNYTAGIGFTGSPPFTEEELSHQFTVETSGADACICAPAGLSQNPHSKTAPLHIDYDQRDLTPQLLFLYYMLFIYDEELTAKVSDNHRRQETKTISLFSDRLWDMVPVKYLLRYARSNLSSYRKFYPRLLQLVTDHMPHLTVGELNIQDELLLDPFWQSVGTSRRTELVCSSRDPNFSTSPSASNFPSPSLFSAAFEEVLSVKKSDDPDCSRSRVMATRQIMVMIDEIITTLDNVATTSSSHLRHLLPYADTIATKMPLTLLENASLSCNRRFGRNCNHLWRSLHSIMPQRLEVLTVASLKLGNRSSGVTNLTSRDLLLDPVERIVMGVDRRVYRCPPVLRILLRILECNLLASRSFWVHRVADRHFLASTNSTNAPSNNQTLLSSVSPPINASSNSSFAVSSNNNNERITKSYRRKKSSSSLENSSQLAFTPSSNLKPIDSFNHSVIIDPLPTNFLSSLSSRTSSETQANSQPPAPLASNEECDRLRLALVVSQDATVVQLLLEFCLPNQQENVLKSEITELSEIRNIICTFIQYLFIVEPSLANVVLWQTYPRSIIPIAVRSIPSLHTSLDSVVDIFRSSGNLDTMVFCLDFVSHLALHYNIRSFLERATFLVEAMHHIFTTILSIDEIPHLIVSCSPCFYRIARAFPNLSPKISTIFLTVMSMMANAAIAICGERNQIIRSLTTEENENDLKDFNSCADNQPDLSSVELVDQYHLACRFTLQMFDRLVISSSAQRHLYFEPGIDKFS